MNRFCCTFVLLSLAVFVAGCGGGEDQFGATIPPKGQRPDSGKATAPPAKTATVAKSTPTAAVEPKSEAPEPETELAAPEPPKTAQDESDTARNDLGVLPPFKATGNEEEVKSIVELDREDAGDWVMFPEGAKDGEWEWGYNKGALRELERKNKEKATASAPTASKSPSADLAPAKSGTLKMGAFNNEGRYLPLEDGNKRDPKVAFEDRKKLENAPNDAKAGKPKIGIGQGKKDDGGAKKTGALAKLGQNSAQDKVYLKKLEARLLPYQPAITAILEQSPVALARDGLRVAGLNSGNHIVIFDAFTGEATQVMPPMEQRVTSMCFNLDASLLFVGTETGDIHLRVVENSRRFDRMARAYRYQLAAKREPNRAHQGSVSFVACSFDGATLVSAGDDGIIKYWRDPEQHLETADDTSAFSGVEPNLAFQAHTGNITALEISRDDAFLTTAGEDKTLKVFSVDDGSRLAARTKYRTRCGAWSLDASRGSVIGSTCSNDVFEWALDASIPAPEPPARPEKRKSGEKRVARGYSLKGDPMAEFFYVPWQLMHYDKVATTMSFLTRRPKTSLSVLPGNRSCLGRKPA